MILNSNPNLSLVHLKELMQFYNLSEPTLNTCAKNGLTDLFKILAFYLEHKSFSQLRAIGSRKDQELIAFCQSFLDNRSHYDAFVAQEALVSKKLAALSNLQKEMVTRHIELEINTLTKNHYDVVMNYLGKDISFDNFAATFIKNEVNLSKHSYFGAKAREKFKTIIKKIKKIAVDYAAISDKEWHNRKFRTILTTTFLLEPKDEVVFLGHLAKKKFPLFYFLHYALENKAFMESRALYMLKHRLGYFEADPKNLAEVATKMSITKERVRQLSVYADGLINQIWNFLATYITDIQSFTNYELPQNGDYKFLTPEFITQINQSEGTHFSKKWVSHCLGALNAQTHCVVGAVSESFKNTYLIRKSLCEVFSFEDFFETIHDQLKEPLYKTVQFNFVDFVSSFLTENPFDALEAVQIVCKNIIRIEYPETIEFDAEKNILFKRNKVIKLSEKIKAVLNAHGEPMTAEEMSSNLQENHKPGAILVAIHKEKQLFIHFGRNRTYGLAEWELTRTDIKGGSIRELVENYLEAFEEPKHISEIVNYVLKYRPKSNFYNINTNLLAEPTHRFRVFKGGFLGLYHKQYEDTDFNELPPFFLKYVKQMLLTSADTGYEAILTQLCIKFKLKSIQIQYLFEKYIKEGIMRREDDCLEIC